MLSDLPIEQQEAPLVKVASEICRWHHERYDGKGYPDGLKGGNTYCCAGSFFGRCIRRLDQ